MYNNITEEMIKIKENCFVNQTTNNDCGLACLTMILKHYGIRISLEELKKDFKSIDEKMSVYDIIKLSKQKGIEAYGYKKVSLEDTKPPCIIHLIDNERQHFVVLIKVLKNKVLIADPARRIMYVDKNDLLRKYTGVTIFFEKKNNVIKSILKNKKMIFKSICFSLLLTFLSSVFSFMIPIIINLINSGRTNYTIILIILFFLLIGILKDFINYFKSIFSVKFQLFIDKFITIPTINKIISLPHMFYHDNGSGNLIAKINDLSYIKDAIFNFIEVAIMNFLLMFFSIFIMFFTNWTIALINLNLIFITFFISHKFILKNLSKSYDLQYLNEKLSNNLTDIFNSILTIKNLVKEKYFKRKIDILYKEVLFKYKDFMISYQKKELLTSILITFFTIQVLIILVIKNCSLTQILFLFSAQTILSASLLEINKLLPLYADFKNVYARVKNIMDQNELTDEKDNIIINNITIKKLNYYYNNKKVLNDISLNINKGDWIMINGPIGSGKTTLFKLLSKQIFYAGNNIFINGINICDIKEEIIRNSIVYVDQKIRLTNESIKDNIFMGDELDEKVIKTAMIDDVLKEKHISYNYVVDNTNSNLSAGQASKIAIAQALNTKRNFIILDETTNSLDVLSEEKILRNIKQNYKDKTLILITHRKSNIKYFNRIITFENGKIIKFQRG